MSPSHTLRQTVRVVAYSLAECGFDPRKTIKFIRGFSTYWWQLFQYAQKNRQADSPVQIRSLFPCITDRYENAGRLDWHYFHQDLWASRKVYQRQPEHHIDVGSRIDGFITHLLTFREVEVLDVRQLDALVSGMSFRQADLMQVADVPSDICDSISCLHAIEHFGLGRYGDPIDPEGHLKGLQSITKLLKSGGTLLLSAPIGREQVAFNAHRVFAPETLPSILKEHYDLVSYSYVDDAGCFYEDADIAQTPELSYGCGMYELKKCA